IPNRQGGADRNFARVGTGAVFPALFCPRKTPHFLRFRLDALTHIKTNSRGYWYLVMVGTKWAMLPCVSNFITLRMRNDYVDGECGFRPFFSPGIYRPVLLCGNQGRFSLARTITRFSKRKVARIPDIFEYAAHQIGRFSTDYLGDIAVSV